MDVDPIVVLRRGPNIVVHGEWRLGAALSEIPGCRRDTGRMEPVWLIPATAAGAHNLVEALDGHVIEMDAGVTSLLDAREAALEARDRSRAREAPSAHVEGATTRPWDHQSRALCFAQGHEACLLHMGMGTGKTRVVLDLIRSVDVGVTLVVCPLAVAPVWPAEAERHHGHADWDFEVLDGGSVADRTDRLETAVNRRRPGRHVVLVINYEAAWRARMGDAIRDLILDGVIELVVADEVHRIKAPGSKVSLYFKRIGLHAPRRVGLSGTPLPHSPLDAYGVFRFLDRGIFGTSFARFRNRYAIMGGFENRQVVSYKRVPEFSSRVASITIRVEDDVLDLPDTVDRETLVRLPPAARTAYEELEDKLCLDMAEGLVTPANALVKLLRLQQVTSGFVGTDEGGIVDLHDAKEAALKEFLEDVGEDEPVVVFCRFTRDVAAVRRASTKLGGSSELSGTIHELEPWRRGDTRVLAAQIQSGSEGIDLTRARYCVFYSLGFSLAQYEQARKRLHRPGQSRRVFYYHLIAPGTIDRRVVTAIRQRRDVIRDILERGIREETER